MTRRIVTIHPARNGWIVNEGTNTVCVPDQWVFATTDDLVKGLRDIIDPEPVKEPPTVEEIIKERKLKPTY
jgi:hypothetical protein